MVPIAPPVAVPRRPPKATAGAKQAKKRKKVEATALTLNPSVHSEIKWGDFLFKSCLKPSRGASKTDPPCSSSCTATSSGAIATMRSERPREASDVFRGRSCTAGEILTFWNAFVVTATSDSKTKNNFMAKHVLSLAEHLRSSCVRREFLFGLCLLMLQRRRLLALENLRRFGFDESSSGQRVVGAMKQSQVHAPMHAAPCGVPAWVGEGSLAACMPTVKGMSWQRRTHRPLPPSLRALPQRASARMQTLHMSQSPSNVTRHPCTSMHPPSPPEAMTYSYAFSYVSMHECMRYSR